VEITQVNFPETRATGYIYSSHLAFGSANSVGQSRSHNEDSLFASNFFAMGLTDPFEIGIFAVADGMGGHQSGEIASSTAINTISSKLLARLVSSPPNLDQENFIDTVESAIGESFMAAQDAVLRTAPGGGTTLTVTVCFKNIVVWGHVGDSRLYHLDKRVNLHRITHDHSLVGRLLELGQLSEAEVEDHPQKNVLIKALGQFDKFKVDLGHFVFEPGEKIMLCSDGLWGQVPDKKILSVIKASGSLAQACNALVQAANDTGGPDNISVILVENQ
jgi:serine/threonine protein phosphatase PrpC